MNTSKYLAVMLSLSLLTGAGCSKMEEQPYGLINTGSFYKTEADALSAIVYAYAVLPEVGYYSRGYYLITELPTENVTHKDGAGQGNYELDQLRTTSTNPDLDNIWTYLYRGISRANAVITNVPSVPNMAEGLRNQITGEGYFLRALHYFNLVRLFGEVPLRMETIDDVSQIPVSKSPIKDAYDSVVNDLLRAETLMTAEKNMEGRANKTAAQALLSKVYLHLASSKASNSPGYDFVSGADDMFALAKTYSGKVINEQSLFGFTDKLREIWDIEVYKKAAVTEHIFDAAVDRRGEREANYSKLPNMYLADPGFDMRVPYDPNDQNSPVIYIGRGWNHFQMEAGIYNSYPANDKRKSELIVSSVINPDGNVITLSISDFSRPFTRKFIDPLRDGDKSSANSPVIRYSDILLVFAEACGPTSEGYAAVNRIRNRAGIGPLNPSLDLQGFRDAIVQERSWELAFEGSRLFDLRRTNTMEKVLVTEYGKTISSGAYFFPIPQREIDTNPLINN